MTHPSDVLPPRYANAKKFHHDEVDILIGPYGGETLKTGNPILGPVWMATLKQPPASTWLAVKITTSTSLGSHVRYCLLPVQPGSSTGATSCSHLSTSFRCLTYILVPRAAEVT